MSKLLLLVIFFLSPLSFANAKEETNIADGALLRGLDKVSGEVVDFGLKSGDTYSLWKLSITLSECRYPVSNPVGDAFAHLKIFKEKSEGEIFRGWMVASSPTLFSFNL